MVQKTTNHISRWIHQEEEDYSLFANEFLYAKPSAEKRTIAGLVLLVVTCFVPEKTRQYFKKTAQKTNRRHHVGYSSTGRQYAYSKTAGN